MNQAAKNLGLGALILVLWFFAVYRPLGAKAGDYRSQTDQAKRLLNEIRSDDASQNARRTHEVELVNAVGYTRPTTEAEQTARMVRQFETACVRAGVGLVDIVPMEPESQSGPSWEDATGQTASINYLRDPLQVQVIGELGGTVALIHWLRQTNPMMMVDRMVMTRDEDGLVRMSAVVSSWRPDIESLSEGGSTS